jgi:hypothetical protein
MAGSTDEDSGRPVVIDTTRHIVFLVVATLGGLFSMIALTNAGWWTLSTAIQYHYPAADPGLCTATNNAFKSYQMIEFWLGDYHFRKNATITCGAPLKQRVIMSVKPGAAKICVSEQEVGANLVPDAGSLAAESCTILSGCRVYLRSYAIDLGWCAATQATVVFNSMLAAAYGLFVVALFANLYRFTSKPIALQKIAMVGVATIVVVLSLTVVIPFRHDRDANDAGGSDRLIRSSFSSYENPHPHVEMLPVDITGVQAAPVLLLVFGYFCSLACVWLSMRFEKD